MQNAVIYCRVSSDKQVTDGHGLESQEHRCREYCKKEGYQVIDIFKDEGISGGLGLEHRKGISDLVEHVKDQKGEKTIVVFDDLKRISRDVYFYTLLKNLLKDDNVEFKSPNFNFEDTPEGRFIETISVATGQLEREQNARQVKQKMKARLEQGYWCISKVRGYKYDKGLLVPDEPEFSLLKNALKKFAKGDIQTPSEFREYLKSKGVKFTESFLYRLIRNMIYAGYYTREQWGVGLTKGNHEPMISMSEFKKIQDRISSRIYKRRVSEEEFWLKKVYSCADCSKNLSCSFSKGRTKSYLYYYCSNTKCKNRKVNIKPEVLLEELDKTMTSVAFNIDQKKEIVSSAKRFLLIEKEVMDMQTKTIEDEIKSLDKKIDSKFKKFDVVSSEIIIKRLESEIEEQQKNRIELADQLEDLKKISNHDQLMDKIDEIISFVENIPRLWGIASNDEKFLMFKFVMCKPLSFSFEEKSISNRFEQDYIRLLGDLCSNSVNGGVKWNNLRTNYKLLIDIRQGLESVELADIPLIDNR